MSNYFESPFLGIPLDRQVTNPNIVAGRYSYYSGYYHGHSFDDCARYLMTTPGVDRLIVGGLLLDRLGRRFHHGRQSGPSERLDFHLSLRLRARRARICGGGQCLPGRW